MIYKRFCLPQGTYSSSQIQKLVCQTVELVLLSSLQVIVGIESLIKENTRMNKPRLDNISD